MRLKSAVTYSFLFSSIIASFAGLFSCNKIHFTPEEKDPVVVPTPPNLAGKPNIILILADDIGYEVPTCNGGQSYSTPALDRMAAGGLRFTNCYALPLSSPSRFMLTTGKYNFRNYTEWGVMNPSEKTIANLLHDNGYATCVAGKWQFDGGDASIKAFGYDKYCVWNAFKSGDEEEADTGSAYKDPLIYQNGAYLPLEQTTGQYGIDIFNRYVTQFIDSSAAHPFFIYYPIPLAEAPFSPTPDDEKYATWKSGSNKSEPVYYASMVKYMDKMIDSLLQKLQSAGLANNTIVLFAGDNGTPPDIVSGYNGNSVTGGMGSTTVYGTHVPLLAYCPGSVSTGVSNSFIGFTDFLPTIMELANTSVPAGFMTDGISFRNQLFQPSYKGRNYLYSYFFPHPEYPTSLIREYVQDTVYKYYNEGYGFYNIALDPLEKTKLNATNATQNEQHIAVAFRKVIDSIHP